MALGGIQEQAEVKARALIPAGKATAADLCYSVQENIFAMLVEVTERAMAHTQKQDVLIVGGVGCNRRLQAMMSTTCEERGGHCFGMDARYCIDNGAMIAQAGIVAFQHGAITVLGDSKCTQRFRTDAVQAIWREGGPSLPELGGAWGPPGMGMGGQGSEPRGDSRAGDAHGSAAGKEERGRGDTATAPIQTAGGTVDLEETADASGSLRSSGDFAESIPMG